MILLFVIAFALHEIEEVIVLPSWVAHHRKLLSKFIPKTMHPVLGISRKGFAVIAIWEGLIVVAVSLFLPNSIWWFGMVAAYTLHLIAHIGQFLYLRKQGVMYPKLYSVPIELPVCFFILYSQVDVAPMTQLLLATFLFSAFAAVNLVMAHKLVWHFGIE